MTPTLHYTETVRHKLWAYVDKLDTEIGGLGYATKDDVGDWLWHDIFLVPQEVSTSEVDMGANDNAGLAFAVEKAHKDKVFDDASFMWVSWHSHGNLAVMWSGTDEDYITKMKDAGLPALWSVVANRKGDHACRLDLFNATTGPMTMEHTKLTGLKLVEYESLFVVPGVEDEIKAMVKKKAPVVMKSGYRTGWTSNAISDPLPGERVEAALASKAGYAEMAWDVYEDATTGTEFVCFGDDVIDVPLGVDAFDFLAALEEASEKRELTA